MSEFKVGDLVTLKSGGPSMVVSGVTTPDQVMVTWADKLDQVTWVQLPTDILRPLYPSGGSVHHRNCPALIGSICSCGTGS